MCLDLCSNSTDAYILLFLLGSYEQQNDILFFLILILINRHSLLSCNLYSDSKQGEMSSLTYRSVSPPFAQRSSLYGLENPSSKNCAEGHDSSIFVSDISNMSRCLLASDSRTLNLFLIEIMFNYPIIDRVIFFSLTSFKIYLIYYLLQCVFYYNQMDYWKDHLLKDTQGRYL